MTGDETASVVAFDGTVRRTIDLTATLTDGGEVVGLDWSPGGRNLAVVTWSSAGVRIWLTGEAGHAPELAAAAASTSGRAWGNPQWSTDGQKLLLELYSGGLYGSDVILFRVVSPDGAAGPAIAERLYHSNRHFDCAGNVAWSPDGTRVAVRTRVAGGRRHQITVISAGDGSVVDQRSDIGGWLIWPAKES